MAVSFVFIFTHAGLALVTPARDTSVATRVAHFSASTAPHVRAGVGRRQATASLLAATGCTAVQTIGVAEGASAAGPAPRVAMETTAGRMEFELWPDVAPKTVDNFVALAKRGFFDGQAFHRIIAGFVIQGGDPNSKAGYGAQGTLEGADVSAVRKWGTGGPGYTIPAEFNERKHQFGVLSMARAADPNSAGSQFFVCLDDLPSLDRKYTTFGVLTKGGDVLRKLGSVETVRGDYPKVRQGITSVSIIDE